MRPSHWDRRRCSRRNFQDFFRFFSNLGENSRDKWHYKSFAPRATADCFPTVEAAIVSDGSQMDLQLPSMRLMLRETNRASLGRDLFEKFPIDNHALGAFAQEQRVAKLDFCSRFVAHDHLYVGFVETENLLFGGHQLAL